MALTDLQLKVASEYAVQGIQKHMAPLTFFAHNFKELEDRPGAAIAVPVFDLDDAADFNSSTNNWCNSEEIDGITVTLDKHLIKSITLDDVTASESDVNFLRDGAVAISRVLGHAANKYVFGLLANVTDSATVDLSTKAAFANLFAVADANDVNPYESVLVLDPTNFSTLLGTMDAYVYGGPEAVKDGIVPGLFGFRAVLCSSYLPDGVVGSIIPYGTLGIASRVNKPAINGYAATFTAADDNGLAIGFRAFEHLCEGRMILGGDMLIGARVLQEGIINLVNQ